MPKDLIDDFLNGSFNLTEIYDTFNRTINIEPFCRNDFLNYILTVDNSTDADILVQALCQLNIRSLMMDMNRFLDEFNQNLVNEYVSLIEFSSIRKRKRDNCLLFYLSLAIYLDYSMDQIFGRKFSN